MGLSYSTQKLSTADKIKNIKKLFDNDEDTDEILESLNMPELKATKKFIPTIGGNKAFQTPLNNTNLTDPRFVQTRNRYDNYDLFKIIKDLENQHGQNQVGGNNENQTEVINHTPNSDSNSDAKLKSLTDEDAMLNIKNIILNELNTLKKNVPQSGGCDCEKSFNAQNGGKKHDSSSSSSSSSIKESSSSSSSSSIVELGKTTKQNKKQTKNNKEIKNNKKLSKNNKKLAKNKFNDSSEYGNNNVNSTSNDPNKSESESENNDYNYDSSDEANIKEEGGLSIFPFNSSDINNSSSTRPSKMLTRKM